MFCAAKWSFCAVGRHTGAKMKLAWLADRVMSEERVEGGMEERKYRNWHSGLSEEWRRRGEDVQTGFKPADKELVTKESYDFGCLPLRGPSAEH